MAEMETLITNENLIKSLEKNRDELNASFEYYNSGELKIDPRDIFNLFAKILNPVFDSGINVSEAAVVSIFRSLLLLISKRLAGEKGRYRDLENYFFEIIESRSALLSLHGGNFLINIFNALLNLNEKKISSIESWARAVSSLPGDTDIEEFMDAGFLLAWVCGAASAREYAAEIIPRLRAEILRKIFPLENADDKIRGSISSIIINDPWRDPADLTAEGRDSLPVFRTAGSFSGYGGEFRTLPAVYSVDGKFYASDGMSVYRIYADYYGVELLRDHSVSPEEVFNSAVNEKFITERKICFNGSQYSIPDEWKSGTSSWTISGSTAVWTLKDSYKLYIAGITGI